MRLAYSTGRRGRWSASSGPSGAVLYVAGDHVRRPRMPSGGGAGGMGGSGGTLGGGGMGGAGGSGGGGRACAICCTLKVSTCAEAEARARVSSETRSARACARWGLSKQRAYKGVRHCAVGVGVAGGLRHCTSMGRVSSACVAAQKPEPLARIMPDRRRACRGTPRWRRLHALPVDDAALRPPATPTHSLVRYTSDVRALRVVHDQVVVCGAAAGPRRCTSSWAPVSPSMKTMVAKFMRLGRVGGVTCH